MSMHAIAHGSVRTHVKESALKVDSGRKIPCCTGESNQRQRRAGPTLYQLSYIPIPELSKMKGKLALWQQKGYWKKRPLIPSLTSKLAGMASETFSLYPPFVRFVCVWSVQLWLQTLSLNSDVDLAKKARQTNVPTILIMIIHTNTDTLFTLAIEIT